MIAAILEREPAPLDLAPPLARVIRTCLAKDPDCRFQNALDLKTALAWAAERPIEAKSSRRAWIASAAATLVLGALGGWALSHFRQPAGDERVLRLQIDPPPGGRFVLGGNVVGDLAISPDGKMAAYTASLNGQTGLWVRPLDGGAARLLPGTENAGQPFWSPDSKSIGFVRLGTTLFRVDPGGGIPISISSPTLALRGATWGGDGYIVFSGFASERAAAAGIYRVPASGGTRGLVAEPDPSRGELAYRSPQVLPDGRFLYVAECSKPETSGLYAASFRKPAERIKVSAATSQVLYASGVDDEGYLLWIRGGTLVAQRFNAHTLQFGGEPQVIAVGPSTAAQEDMHIAASATGLLMYGVFGEVSQLAWFDRTGTLIRSVGEPADIRMFRLSPDERHVAVQIGTRGGSDLWLLDTERGVSSRLTADTGHSTQPVWSPDSSIIVFTHLSRAELLRKAANGVGDEQVLVQRPSVTTLPTDWSGDGRWILTREASPDTAYDIWKIPTTPEGKIQEGATPTPYLRTRFTEGQAHFSPEPSPRWVAYVSDESGRPEVYIDAFPEPRGEKRISTAGGTSPWWGPGSRELFYVSPENKLMAVSLKVGADTVEPSSPRELFTLPLRSPAGPTYEPSRDGRRFLVLTSQGQGPQSLNVIVNWPALLKKAVPAP